MDNKNLFCVAFLLLLCTTCATKSSQQKSKSVTTLIEAKWPATPYLLETCEYIAEEAPEMMWLFIESINDIDSTLTKQYTEKDWYNKILENVKKVTSSAQVSMLKLALSMRAYSPRVEMYSQMAQERGVPESKCPGAVVDVGGTLVCEPSEIEKTVKLVQNKEREDPDLYKLDHHYRSNIPNSAVPAVLYAEIGTERFKQFHEVLKDLAHKELIDYVLRHYIPPQKRQRAGKLYLSGYGVELQIKSTEYKVQDDSEVKDEDNPNSTGGGDPEEVDEVEGFNFGRLKILYPDKTASLAKLRQHLIDTNSDLAPLKAWQLQELSLQAAERIMSSPSEEALKTFNLIAHNFPLQARSLVRIAVSNDLKKEIRKNQESFLASLSLQPSDSALFLNGLFYDVDTLDAGTLLETARSELRTMEGLHEVGVKQHQLGTLLALDFLSASGPASMSHAVSAATSEYALDIRDSAVLWVNNIEHDKQYRRWSESLMELLRPTFPGMLRSVRKNIYNLVLIVDPKDVDARPLLRLAESFLVHQAPLHIGIVFAVNSDSDVTGRDDAGVALLEAYNYAAELGNPQQGLSLITDVYASVVDEDGVIPVELVEAAFIGKFPKADADLVFGPDSQYDTGRKLAKEFVDRSGFRKLPKVLLNGIPLPSDSLDAETFEEAVLTEIMSQTPSIQRAVYKGELSDKDDVIDYLMDQPNVMPRLNDRILDSKSKYLDMSGKMIADDVPERLKLNLEDQSNTWPENFSSLSEREQVSQVVYRARYLARKEGEITHPLTLWVAADLDTPEGRDLLKEALDNLQSTTTVRLTYLANPNTIEVKDSQPLTKLAVAALEYLPSNKAITFLSELTKEVVVKEFLSNKDDFKIQGIEENELKGVIMLTTSPALLTQVKAQASFCRNVLLLPPSGRAVVANGRILGPLDEGERLNADDFALLDKFSMTAHTDRLQAAIKKADEAAEDAEPVTRGRKSSDLIMRLVAILVSRPQSRSRFEVPYTSDQFSVVKLEPRRKDQPTFEVSVIVDPVSRGAQKIGPILSVLHDAINCRIRIYLNAAEKHSDMPLKSFYRYVLESEPQFTPDGKIVTGPIARFINMPQSVLLTQNMHPPENWLVEAVRSPYDLDNIRLEDVMSSVHSEFELSSLLLEGHCSESASGTPPRGLQVTLGTRHEPVIVDTIVMANLGYFQLKANPGAWLLRLRQGRSADIFDIISVDGSDTPAKSTDQHVLISSLKSNVLKLKVAKKPDKLSADLLAEDDAPTLWNSITRPESHIKQAIKKRVPFWSDPFKALSLWWQSTFGQGGGGTGEEGVEEERLNIFSLASGHLYERFLRIMMLSVIKHTKTPVKFWFLKNYLSPTFKDFLPHMAREYGFEYGLVEYKWPRWLHQQTEKQRIIWGYKILFLDVLFPLDVKKIIFVDADQVVRTDLKELRDLDLGGAPYGYTPFCESRKEMDGFRFWKTGYWRNHLQGRKYHISALYVVDLRKFRRVAAGDRLRGQYQALSQDPNSLSNLDQDLPNNMIHQVAIKSLPQEWLWCETWCDNESKAKAKTIDLCNNPLTKEAKLTAAMRILPEWQDYDNEIKQVQEKINSEHHHPQQDKVKAKPHDSHEEL